MTLLGYNWKDVGTRDSVTAVPCSERPFHEFFALLLIPNKRIDLGIALIISVFVDDY